MEAERTLYYPVSLQIVPVKSFHPVVLVYQNLEKVRVYSEPML